jgi:hypothetical protein
MFLCEVALGESFITEEDKPDFRHPPEGFDSVVGVGRTDPGQWASLLTKNQVSWPNSVNQ